MDLAGDAGVVGRLLVAGPSRQRKGAAKGPGGATGDGGGGGDESQKGEHEVRFDLKGRLYRATLVASSSTLAVVNVQADAARVEAVARCFVRLDPEAAPGDEDGDGGEAGDRGGSGIGFEFDDDEDPWAMAGPSAAAAAGAKGGEGDDGKGGGAGGAGGKKRKKAASSRSVVCISSQRRASGRTRSSPSTTPRSRRQQSTSVLARTVAVRTEWCSIAVSPKTSPCLSEPSTTSRPSSPVVRTRARPSPITRSASAGSP